MSFDGGFAANNLKGDLGLEWEEAWDYQPGFTVELKSQPGQLHVIEGYDPMMVPPVWLADDPMPRYPHELKVISCQTQYACPLALPVSATSTQRSAVVA